MKDNSNQRPSNTNNLRATTSSPLNVAVVGGGPAGLVAAKYLVEQGAAVTLFDAMPSVGRKFLLAGKGGLNLTHAEPLASFKQRFREAQPQVAPWLDRFGPQAIREFAKELGIETIIGTSGRVFPADFKAGPMMRSWVRALKEAGVRFEMNHRFKNWSTPKTLHFETPAGEIQHQFDAILFALGGGSWSKLGSDGQWIHTFNNHGIKTRTLRAANCGFECQWSEIFSLRFQGEPLKNIHARAHVADEWTRGEAMITQHGIEGSLVYALSAALRSALESEGSSTLWLDLLPDQSHESLLHGLSSPRGSRSRTEHWRRKLNLSGAKAGLVLEVLEKSAWDDAEQVARLIKNLPITLKATRPLDEAISSAGGVCFDALDSRLMLKQHAGHFVAGEMIDWEAPTGGYLLTASMASGVVAAEGLLAWWQEQSDAM